MRWFWQQKKEAIKPQWPDPDPRHIEFSRIVKYELNSRQAKLILMYLMSYFSGNKRFYDQLEFQLNSWKKHKEWEQRFKEGKVD